MSRVWRFVAGAWTLRSRDTWFRLARDASTCLLACLALGFACGCGKSSARVDNRGASPGATERLQLGDYASYSWFGPIHSVGASWTVPRILGPHAPAAAFTWIGAQGPFHQGFIQVGVETAVIRAPDGQWGYLYFAAWSDDRRQARLRPLFDLRPDDRVVARLSHGRGTWRVSLIDLTSHQAARFVTREEGRAEFARAEWAQEHSGHVGSGTVGYPELSKVSIHAVKVNGETPRGRELVSRWMSIPSTYLAPTPLRDDGFSVRSAGISLEGTRYVNAVSGDDIAAERVNELLAAPHPSVSEIHVAARSQALALRAENRSLSGDSWKPGVTPLIKGLLVEDEAALRWCLEGETRSARNLGAWARSFPNPPAGQVSFGRRIRRALGVPDDTYVGPG